MEVDDSQLAAMGLHSQRAGVDECLGFSNWPRKSAVHQAVKAQTGTMDRPNAEEWFRTERGVTNTNAGRCNVSIYVIKIQATVIAGEDDGTDKRLPDEYFLCKKETGEWAVKHLVTSPDINKKASHLRHAADINTYSIPGYSHYIPIKLFEAANKYVALFLAKYGPDNRVRDIWTR